MKLLPAAVVFVGSFFAFAFLFLAAPVIPDADSYYHLAVAREYAAGGYMDSLPWARFSVLGKTFGDKDFLFHALLAPFASATDAATGGRLALALLNATFAAMLTAFATRSLGWFSVVVPLWLYVAAPMLTFRLIRLRPELLALLLLMVLIRVASAKRYVWVAVLAAVFALSYTAFHVVLGLSVLWFLVNIREREWMLPLSAGAGTLAGLLLHPGFPDNLRVWWVQNVLLFLSKAKLDAATELGAPTTDSFFLASLGWWAGMALLWIVSRGVPADRRRVAFVSIAAAVFLVLTLVMQRMAVYFVPLATMMLFTKLEAQPLRRPARLAVALLVVSLLSLPASNTIVRELLLDGGWEADYAAFGKALPPEAKVAAHWGAAEFYSFWAPQGRYLNVLDPIFMATAHPEVYAAQRRVFDNAEPDVPRIVEHVLDSDYIAFNAASPLFERMQYDPRIVPVFNSFTFLGRIDARGAQQFVRDWRLANGASYRITQPAAAYIDARLVSNARCIAFTHEETVTAPVRRMYELTSSGTAELRINDTLLLRTGPSRAILGAGTIFEARLAAGTHQFVVTTCAASTGANGFYLLQRR